MLTDSFAETYCMLSNTNFVLHTVIFANVETEKITERYFFLLQKSSSCIPDLPEVNIKDC